uniref:Germinal-center associated nuclear protein n=1 Tax=Rhizophora mucronata TaxID=61149 RepID=A0A2P2LFI5_RHIMU
MLQDMGEACSQHYLCRTDTELVPSWSKEKNRKANVKKERQEAGKDGNKKLHHLLLGQQVTITWRSKTNEQRTNKWTDNEKLDIMKGTC